MAHAKNSFNAPHENSVLATCDKETRVRMNKARSAYMAHFRELERWAASGFVAGSDADDYERI